MAQALAVHAPFGPLGRLWQKYERQLQRRPIITQMTTSGLMWGLGDAIGQRLGEPQQRGIDVRRTALTALFGAAYIGPVGHLWYANLDRFCACFGAASSMQFLLAKVLADNFGFGSLYIATYFAFSSAVIERAGWGDFKARMQTEFVPTMLAELAVWPPYMAFVFSKVPVQHQLLFVNLLTLLDVAFLSYISSQEDWPESLAAALKRNQQQHAPRILHHFTNVIGGGGFSTGGGSTSGAQSSSSEDLDIVEAMRLSSSLGGSGASGLGLGGFWGMGDQLAAGNAAADDKAAARAQQDGKGAAAKASASTAAKKPSRREQQQQRRQQQQQLEAAQQQSQQRQVA